MAMLIIAYAALGFLLGFLCARSLERNRSDTKKSKDMPILYKPNPMPPSLKKTEPVAEGISEARFALTNGGLKRTEED